MESVHTLRQRWKGEWGNFLKSGVSYVWRTREIFFQGEQAPFLIGVILPDLQRRVNIGHLGTHAAHLERASVELSRHASSSSQTGSCMSPFAARTALITSLTSVSKSKFGVVKCLRRQPVKTPVMVDSQRSAELVFIQAYEHHERVTRGLAMLSVTEAP